MVDIIRALASWTVLVAVKLFLTIVGLPVIAVALRFPVDKDNARPFLEFATGQHPGWFHRGLPKWAWIWSNERDGAIGDKRGWWFLNCDVGENGYDILAQWWWLAIRNPVNNLEYVPFFGVDMFKAEVKVLAGQDQVDDDDDGSKLGWNWLTCNDGKFNYYHFHFLKQWPMWMQPDKQNPRAFEIRVGHKMDIKHNEEFKGAPDSEDEAQRAYKGFTFRIRPWFDYKN